MLASTCVIFSGDDLLRKLRSTIMAKIRQDNALSPSYGLP